MQAVVKVRPGPGNVELIEVPEPAPGPGEVKIEIKATGVCGTDIHIQNDRFQCKPPVILGHEIAGDIVEVGTGVSRFQPGEKVTLNPGAGRSCGSCSYCKRGYYMFCPQREGIGSRINGGFARYIVVRENIVLPLPETISYEAGALSEPLACAVQAVLEQSQIKTGDLVYISGPGLMGLLATQLALTQGGRVVVGGLPQDVDRLILAKELGAQTTVTVGVDEVNQIVRELGYGYGANVVFECAGSEGSLRQCMDLIAPLGQLTQVGIMNGPVTLNYNQIFFKQLEVRGSFAANWRSWGKAIDLLNQGAIQLEPLVSAKMPLSRWEQAFANLQNKVGIRNLLYPTEG